MARWSMQNGWERGFQQKQNGKLPPAAVMINCYILPERILKNRRRTSLAPIRQPYAAMRPIKSVFMIWQVMYTNGATTGMATPIMKHQCRNLKILQGLCKGFIGYCGEVAGRAPRKIFPAHGDIETIQEQSTEPTASDAHAM